MIKTLNRSLLLIAFVLLTFHFLVYIIFAINLIQFPFDYDQGEGFELVDVMMFSEGQFPYQDIETYPFYGSIYPPLYHVLLVPFAWLFGPAYWYGRLFSFVTTLITALAIGYAVYRESQHNKLSLVIALLSGLAFLSSNIIYHIGPLFRQHIPMFMFETLAIVVLAHVNEMIDTKQRRRRLLLGFALLMAAGYTKQLAAFTAIATLAFLFIRNPRRAVWWGVGFAAIGAAIFIFLTIATNGHWWTQTITANVKDFIPAQSIGLLKLFLRLHGWLLIPAGLMVVYELYFARLSIYSIWLVVTIPLAAYSAGTWGAGDSYYSTSIAALCILSGIFASKTLNQTWTFKENYLSALIIRPFHKLTPQITMAGLLIIPLFYIGYAKTTLHMPTQTRGFSQIANFLNIEANAINGFYDSAGRITGAYADIGHLLTQADIDAGNQIVDIIKTIPDDRLILSEEAAFSFATGRDVITNPVVLYILDQVGHYDSSELVNMLNEQVFGLIVLRAQFFPVAVNQAITANYVTKEDTMMNGFRYMIMYPR